MTAHGSPLGVGPGSFNVLIGKRPAWRGISAAQAAKLAQTFTEGMEKIIKAQAKVTATMGTPAAPVAAADLVKTVAETVAQMASLMASFAADTHACPIVKVVVPDGAGVVINGSQTVLINGMAACRLGDTIQEATSVNSIAVGEFTVLIGGWGERKNRDRSSMRRSPLRYPEENTDLLRINPTIYRHQQYFRSRDRKVPFLRLTTVVGSSPDLAKVKYPHLYHLAKLRAYYDNRVRSVTRYVDVIHYQLLVIKVLRTYLVTFLVV